MGWRHRSGSQGVDGRGSVEEASELSEAGVVFAVQPLLPRACPLQTSPDHSYCIQVIGSVQHQIRQDTGHQFLISGTIPLPHTLHSHQAAHFHFQEVPNGDVEVVGPFVEEFGVGQMLCQRHAAQDHQCGFLLELEQSYESQQFFLKLLIKTVQKLLVIGLKQVLDEVSHSISHHLMRLILRLLLLESQIDASQGQHAGLHLALDQSVVDDEHDVPPDEGFEVVPAEVGVGIGLGGVVEEEVVQAVDEVQRAVLSGEMGVSKFEGGEDEICGIIPEGLQQFLVFCEETEQFGDGFLKLQSAEALSAHLQFFVHHRLVLDCIQDHCQSPRQSTSNQYSLAVFAAHCCDAAVEVVTGQSHEFLTVEVATVIQFLRCPSGQTALLEVGELVFEGGEEEVAVADGALHGLSLQLAELVTPGLVLFLQHQRISNTCRQNTSQLTENANPSIPFISDPSKYFSLALKGIPAVLCFMLLARAHQLQFFCMQAQQSFIPKCFQLCNELTGKMHSFNIQVPYLAASREINISRAISNICTAGLNLANCHIFYLDFARKLYVHLGLFPFRQEVYLKLELFLDTSIKIRFRSIVQRGAAGQPDQSAPLPKKKKVKERTIRQARDFVAEWRWLYEQVDGRGKRIYTLDTAAQKVGLAKKTLDDYLYQMRQGEYFGFKFQEHEHEKIGILRRFVRQCLERENSMAGEAVAPVDDIDKYLGSSDSEEDGKNN